MQCKKSRKGEEEFRAMETGESDKRLVKIQFNHTRLISLKQIWNPPKNVQEFHQEIRKQFELLSKEDAASSALENTEERVGEEDFEEEIEEEEEEEMDRMQLEEERRKEKSNPNEKFEIPHWAIVSEKTQAKIDQNIESTRNHIKKIIDEYDAAENKQSFEVRTI